MTTPTVDPVGKPLLTNYGAGEVEAVVDHPDYGFSCYATRMLAGSWHAGQIMFFAVSAYRDQIR